MAIVKALSKLNAIHFDVCEKDPGATPILYLSHYVLQRTSE